MKIFRYLPLIGIALFVYIILNTGPGKILQSFANINLFFTAMALLAALVVFITRSMKFKMVAGVHNLQESLSSCCKIWAVGLFTGMVTPGRVGDFIKVFYLDKKQPLGKRLSVVILDRIIDLTIVLSSAIIGVILINYWFGQIIISFWIILIVFIGFFVAIYLLTKKNFMKKILRPVFSFFIPEKYKERLKINFDDFYSTIGRLKNKKKRLAIITGFNVFIWLFSVLEVIFFGLMIGISFDYFFIFAVMSVMVIIELIPVSVSGIGTREAFLLLILPMIGLSEGAIISFSIIYLIIGYWSVAFLGWLFWIKNPVKIEL